MQVAIIGSGNVGSQVARGALAAGIATVLANARGPASLETLVHELGPGASAATVPDAVRGADLAVVAVPIDRYPDLPADAFDQKIVVDTGNYFPAWNGPVPELDSGALTSSERLQRLLPGATVVKTLNHLVAAAMTADALPSGTAHRRALAMAGDDAQAKGTVRAFLDAIGFDVVDAGALSEGWRFEGSQPAVGSRLDADELTAALATASRNGG